MKTIVFPALLALVAVVSSCHTETVVCEVGHLTVNSVGFDSATVMFTRVYRYVANTSTLVDSAWAPKDDVGHDTFMMFVAQPGYDYKVRMHDSSVFFFNNITLSGMKTQSFKRGPITGKKIGCIDRIVSCDVNGARQDLSMTKYQEMFFKP